MSDVRYKVTTKIGTAAVARLAALPDADSPVGSCPALPRRWHERDSGTCRIPSLSELSCHLRPPVVRSINGAACGLVLAGRAALARARTHCLDEISVQWCDCPIDVAILSAAHELLHDPELHRSTAIARDLISYMQWLTRQATIYDEGCRYRVGPVIQSLFDNPGRRGVVNTISAITGYSTRALRARATRYPRQSEPVPALPQHDARMLIQGEVRRVMDPGTLPGTAKGRNHRPQQYELHLTRGGAR